MKPEEILDKGKSLLNKKAQDYTENSELDRYQNFQRSAELISWFRYDQDRAYVALIGTKLARLAALLNTHKEPNNESIEDSFVDLVNYCALWAGYRIKDNKIVSGDENSFEKQCYFWAPY